MRATPLILTLSALLLTSAGHGAPKIAKKPGAVHSKVAIDAKLLQAVLKARSQAKSTRTTLKLSAAQEAQAVKLHNSLTVPQRAALSRIAAKILDSAAKNQGKLSPKLGDAIGAEVKLFPKTNAKLLAIATYRASVALAADRLDATAKKLEDQRARVQRLRQSIAELRDELASWGKASSRPISWTEGDGQRVTQTLTQSATQAVLTRLEMELSKASNMTEMMQMDLQSAMQNQTKAYKLLSAILKSQHDTLKAIISNIRA